MGKRIIGEVRCYDPYAHKGEVMFYDLDTFGFIDGYINDNFTVMSKMDILNDERMTKELGKSEYEMWKRHNIVELKSQWETFRVKYGDFEGYCKRKYKRQEKL